MKELGKCRAVIALLCFTATVFSGCGNRTEAVITDGEDITTVSAEYPTLEESHADIFTYKDLKIGNISYLMTESQVIAILGKPKEETENDGEKIYSYNEMSIGFEKLDDNNRPSGSGVYKVTQAASIGSDDKFSRNMRVGQSADDILKMYYRDADYQNHLYMSEDKTLTYGKLLYGDFTIAQSLTRLIQKKQLHMDWLIIMDIVIWKRQIAIILNLHMLMVNIKVTGQRLMMILPHLILK
ncbi:MAG: hypothetical protein ACLR7D_14990 [Lachnospira eligens]